REGYDFQWNAISDDSEGRLWAGTGFGLWRILPKESDQYRLYPVFVPKRRLIIWSIRRHPAGGFWLGITVGIIQNSFDRVHRRVRVTTILAPRATRAAPIGGTVTSARPV